MKKDSVVIRVDKSTFMPWVKGLQMKMTEREHKIPSMTEVTRRIAIESVHPYEDAKKGFRKIGDWKL